MPITQFSEEEIEDLATRIANKLLPDLVEALKNKAKWTVNNLQGEHFTAKEVAGMFSCSHQTIYKLAKENKIDSVTVGKSGVRFSRNAIEKAQREGLLG